MVVGMTAAARTATSTSSALVEASPAEIRAALVPEDRSEFDRQYREALAAASESYSLGRLEETLAAWRRVAMVSAAATLVRGPEGYRRMLAEAERTRRTGELPVGSMPWSQLKAELGL